MRHQTEHVARAVAASRICPAAQSVLQLRAGLAPLPDSSCVDGSWDVTPASVKFTRNIEVEAPGIRYPLEYAR